MHEDEWEEILQRFNEEGLDTNLPDERKLLYIWRWLVDAETNCISLRHQLDKLRKRQADELKEIRNCMEQMCNTWEVKVSNLEDQNRQFQAELDLNTQNSGNLVTKGIQQMLLEDGLHGITNLPLIQQVSYLLDERAQLKLQVDKEIERRRKCEQLARMVSNLPDCLKISSPQIQRMLDRQKDEYEEEIRHQQETMKSVKEQLKQVHEEELNRLTKEKEQLSSELSKASERIQELVTHMASEQGKELTSIPWVQYILDGSHEKEMYDLKLERDQTRELCQDQQHQIKEQNETINLLQRTNKQLELDTDTLAYKFSESLAQIDELEDELHREAIRGKRESVFKPIYVKETAVLKNNINSSYLDNRPNYQDRENSEWKERFEASQKELVFVRSMLTREQEWRINLEADYRKLHNSSLQLQTGLMEKENMCCDMVVDLIPNNKELSKNSSSRVKSGSPSHKKSVWPVLPLPKKW